MFYTPKGWRSVSMKYRVPLQKRHCRQWHVIDAENVVLGKLASKAAMLLMGKHKPSYTPFWTPATT